LPTIFIGEEDQMGVVNFLDKVEQFVELGARFGPLKLDKCIDVVSWYTAQGEFEWVYMVWA
jgi:hypothetical protein